MARPAGGYHLKDGSKVPGVTTVCGRFKESGALIYWAWDQGRQGKDFRETSKAAADAGTLAHSLVEASIKHEIFAKPEGTDEATWNNAVSAFGAYETWAKHSNLEMFETEMSLVSETHKFGGTPDAIGYTDGKLSLIDFKTSNSVYADYLIQIAAYRALWEENRPEYPITGGFHLLRFAKTNGDFAHHFYPDLSEAWELFLLYRRAYDIDKSLGKRVK